MNAIGNHLQDPGWWFTAVIIAIIASVVAGFMKDYLEKKFGLFLIQSKEKRQKRQLEKQEFIEAWSQNEGLVAIVYLRAVVTLVTQYASIILNLLIVMYLKGAYGEYDKLPIHSIALLVLAVMSSVFMAWVSSIEMSYARQCFRKYRLARKLPFPFWL